MSVLTPKRLFLSVAAVVLSAASAFGGHPSTRSYARSAYLPDESRVILFGGESAVDPGTQLQYNSDETWAWDGSRWAQLFPATSPSARAAHQVAYDTTRSRIVLFGGRQAKTTVDGKITLLNDTWVWKNNNWQEVVTSNAPDPRHLMAMAYDSARDRVVLFGGSEYAANGEDFEAQNDTWEFDGTNWTQVDITGTVPVVNFPQLAYDANRNLVILMGVDNTLGTLMSVYHPDTRSWEKKTPEKLPACANDSSLVYRTATGNVALVGGVCSSTTPQVESTWEYDGNTWTEFTTGAGRSTGHASAYDQLRDLIVLNSGFPAFVSTPTAATTLLQGTNARFGLLDTRPAPRSLHFMKTDPVTNNVWMFGGLNEYSDGYSREFWGYRNNQWFPLQYDVLPPACEGPLAAYDTNRSRLVVVCFGADMFEYDGTAWTSKSIEKGPANRHFASVAYDDNIKKVVMFGGFDGTNYRNDTWTWDGNAWTEVKNNKPTNRAMMAMWYDPNLRKTIIYGGLGRKNLDERVTRYSDMYSFDGNGWTKMNITNTPGERMGPQYAIDPRSNKLILFGGLRSELDASGKTRRQFYDNDTWQWDGAANSWTHLTPANAPPARENGAMAWDPVAQELVMFGGYSGLYFSDTWAFTGTNWVPRGDAPLRRRPSRAPHEPAVPSIGNPTSGE